MKSLKLLLILVSGIAFAQKQFEGKIIADSLEGIQINIVNITNKQGTTTRKNGCFSIIAEVKDSIVFSSVKHDFKYHIVQAKDFTKIVEIQLNIAINELPEVILNPYNLSGDIAKDISQIPENNFDQTEIGLGPKPRRLSYPERELKRVEKMSFGLYNSVSLDYIIMSINGDIAELKRLRESNLIVKRKNQLQSYFKHDFIIQELQIDSLNVEDFLFYCAENTPFMNLFRADKLAVFDSIKQMSVQYNSQKFKPVQD